MRNWLSEIKRKNHLSLLDCGGIEMALSRLSVLRPVRSFVHNSISSFVHTISFLETSSLMSEDIGFTPFRKLDLLQNLNLLQNSA